MLSLQLHSSLLIVLPGLAGGTLTGEAAMYSVSSGEKEGQGRNCPVQKPAILRHQLPWTLLIFGLRSPFSTRGKEVVTNSLGIPTSHLCVISAGWPSEEGWREKPATGRIQSNGTSLHWRLCWGQHLVVLQFCECDCCLPGTQSPMGMALWIVNKLQWPWMFAMRWRDQMFFVFCPQLFIVDLLLSCFFCDGLLSI